MAARLAQPVLTRLNQFADIHKDETCYIFGDGGSSKYFDLSNFSNHSGFLLNHFAFRNKSELSKIKFTYGINPSPFLFFRYPYLLYKEKDPIVNRFFESYSRVRYREIMKLYPETHFFLNLSNYFFVDGENISYLFKDIKDFEFAKSCREEGVSIYSGAFTVAITLAIFMGFKKIILVGCDYTHENSRLGHWYEKGVGPLFPQVGYQENFLRIAKDYVDIVTITLDGGSKLLPALTYLEYTGMEPSYRENIELADLDTLKMLSKWPDYKIF